MLVLLGASGAADAAVSLDASEVSLSPSASPQNFFINMTLTNNAPTPVTIIGWQFRLNFTPSIAPSNIAVTGFSNNMSPGAGVGSNPSGPYPVFVTVSLRANSFFVTAPVTVPGNSSQTVVQVDMQLAANALTNLYNISISNAEISYSNFTAEIPSVGTGSIATPEPSVAVCLAGALWLAARRRECRFSSRNLEDC